MQKQFIKKYISTINENLNQLSSDKFFKFIELIYKIKKNNNKIIFVGNGGSASIAAHSSVDFVKACGVRAINFNETNLVTCFANDYGYEKWVEQALIAYSHKNDLVVLISSSGQSKNIINAAKYCKKNKINCVTFTGFKISNPVKNLGKINFWVNSKSYNIIEMTHQTWVLMAVDYISKNNK